MTEDGNDLSRLLRAAERPRALTDAEFTRIHGRLTKRDSIVGDQGPDRLTVSQPADPVRRDRRRFGSSVALVGGSIAAMSVLFVVLSTRQSPEPAPIIPISALPNETLPSPLGVGDEFCAEHVDAISNALMRWRGVENWAWARGTPDIGELVDGALSSAADFDDTVLASEATVALARLREELAAVDGSLSDRDAVLPTVEAVQHALDTVIAVARRVTPPCDIESLATARNTE